MSEGLARRLCPIGNTFINVPGCRIATAKRRTHSFPGYITLQHREEDLQLPGGLIVDDDMNYVILDGPNELVESLGTKTVVASDEIKQQCTLPRIACCSSGVSTTTDTEGCQSSCETVTEPGTPTWRRTVESEYTTLMIRNLPHDLMQMDLIAKLDENGFEGTYDFLYMPSNFISGRGKGYAFVNFTQQAAARRLVSEWHKQVRFGAGRNRGGLSISAAAVQGREANVKKWDVPRMRRIKNPNFRPLVAVKPTSGGPCVLVPSCSMDSEAALIAEGPQLGGVARRQFPGQANHWTRHGQAASGRTGGRAGQAPVQ